ncbi:helix-turn-helix domain-containing protein, partial [Microbacterium sp. LMI12-1-1.1]|uniref:helix-turn-helix domain-containing protein n=1 Tax=Microbacterium sp. LMI12-1-1.1 TaxID=3135225 RepID=UPI0034339AB2
MTDKRRQFLGLLDEGWSVRGACKKLGISRSSGNRWKNGSFERQKDGTVKFVPPLELLAARTISPRFLSEAERIQIADLASRGLGPTAIGR